MKSVATSLVFLLALGAAAQASQTIMYPTTESPSFMITAPDDWKLDPADEEGGYFDLNGPTGAVLSFRTVEGTDEGMKNAIQECIDYLNETYNNVKLDKPVDHKVNGLEGFYAVGTGKDKEDGSNMVFGMAWYALKDGSIGEIWFACEATDKAGADQADKILNSFKAK